MRKKLTLQSRVNSFGYAGSGLRQLLQNEPNAQLHFIATFVVVAAGLIKGLAAWQWVALVLAIALVWITEALNTCIELLCDFAGKGAIHPVIKTIKDIAAGAVLISAIASVVIAAFVFLS